MTHRPRSHQLQSEAPVTLQPLARSTPCLGGLSKKRSKLYGSHPEKMREIETILAEEIGTPPQSYDPESWRRRCHAAGCGFHFAGCKPAPVLLVTRLRNAPIVLSQLNGAPANRPREFQPDRNRLGRPRRLHVHWGWWREWQSLPNR